MISFETKHGIADLSNDVVRFYEQQCARPEVVRALTFRGQIPTLAQGIKALVGIEIYCLTLLVTKAGYPFTENPRMLIAHGDSGGDNYSYYDDSDSSLPVDDWLNEHDGLYDSLYVACCNNSGIELEPRRSLIVYPLGLNSSRDILFAGLLPTALTILPPRHYNPRNPNLRLIK